MTSKKWWGRGGTGINKVLKNWKKLIIKNLGRISQHNMKTKCDIKIKVRVNNMYDIYIYIYNHFNANTANNSKW